MDEQNLDKIMDQYVEQLVGEIMASPHFASLPDDQKEAKKEEVANYFYQRVIDLALDEMSEEQLEQIKDMDFNSPEMAPKLEELTSQIPGFAYTIEEDFEKQAEVIKQTGLLPPEDLPVVH